MSFIMPTAASTSAIGGSISAQTGVKGSFDDFFKNYLTAAETQKNAPAEQSEASAGENSLKNVRKVIDELDIPSKQKEELKKELDSLETEEDAVDFLNKLEEILMLNGIGVTETVNRFAEAFVADDAVAAGTSSLDSAMLRALKVKGYTENAGQNLNADEQKAVQAAFEKILRPGEAEISKEEVKAAEIVKPAVQENIPADEQILPKTTDSPDTDIRETVMKSGQSNFAEQEQPEVKITAPRDINKIVDYIQYSKIGDQKKLTVQLIPKELGKLNIELVEHAGKISAKITTESDQAKNLLINNAESIRQQLEAKGIVLEKMEFLFAEKDSRDGTDQQAFRKKGTAGGQKEFAVGDLTEDEAESSRGLYA
jgi:flagellar hook-length control protein FliK